MMNTNSIRTAVLAAVVMATVVLRADAQLWTNVYTNISGQPGYEVPGFGGTGFKFSATSALVFSDIVVSGNGNWALRGRAELATSTDDILIVNGQVVAQEDTPAPFTSGDNYGPISGIGGYVVDINNDGTYAFKNNTSGATASDEYILKGQGVGLSVVANEGQPTGILSGVSWFGDGLNNVHIADDGTVGFTSFISGDGVTAANSDVAVFGDQIVARRGVTVPTNQSGGSTATLDVFGQFSMNRDGSSYVLEANLTGFCLCNDSVIVDNEVVIEALQLTGGMFSPVREIWGVYMDDAGNWFARGINDDGQDWIIRNGVVIAAENQPVAGGAELWTPLSSQNDGAFSFMTGNGVGDWLIGGADNSGPGGSLNQLLMLNGDVIARRGDPVDLDGNGLLDDDAYFGGNFFDGGIADDGTIYVTTYIQDGSGTRLGSGLFVLSGATVPEPASGVLMLCGAIGLLRLRRRTS